MSNPYLTFSSSSSFTLNVVDNLKYWDGTLEYSTDTTTWNTWSGTSAISSASDGTKHNLYLRGTGNTYITGSSASNTVACWVLTGSNISCDGNIENLLDYATVSLGNHPVMAAYCYNSLLRGNANLISAPELPVNTLTDYCYAHIFRACTSLTTSPALPATTLANNCYQRMFNDCTLLTTLPELPATTLVDNCYSYMFNGCSLIKLSETQTGEYQTPYRVPSDETGTSGSNSLNNMFGYTSGSFTGTLAINTTYYTSNIIIPAGEPQPVASIYIGNLSLAKSFIGNSEVDKILFGNVLIYEKASAVDPILENNDWATIKAVCESGQAANYWAVGATKTVTGSDNNVRTVRLDHIGSIYGTKHAVFSFLNRTETSETWASSNVNDYSASNVKTNIDSGGSIFTVLVSNDLAAQLTDTTVQVAKGSNDGTLVNVTGKLFLPAEREIFASRTYSRTEEWNALTQFGYYATVDTSDDARKRYKATTPTSAGYWWLRSPYSGSSNAVVYVNSNGDANYNNASNTYGVAPCFAF